MPVTLVGAASPEPSSSPALLLLRTFDGLRGVLAVLEGGREVLAVRRANDADWRRALDVLSGWAVARHGARPATGADVTRSSAGRRAISPPRKERRARIAAAAGDGGAPARLVDVYAESAALVAL